jgi:hypothetical protein
MLNSEPVYGTILENQRKTAVNIYEKNGEFIGVVPPQSEILIETSNTKTVCGPYERIIFRKDGSLKLVKADDRPEAYPGAWTLTLRNEIPNVLAIFSDEFAGSIAVAEIPVVIKVQVGSVHIMSKELVYKNEEVMQRQEGLEFLVPKIRSRWIPTRRDERDIKRIEHEIAEVRAVIQERNKARERERYGNN